MRLNGWKQRDWNRGGAMVEFALVAPLLLLMCMGATDFGRMFFNSVTAANAAGTGAFFGALDTIQAGDFGEMQRLASEDAGDLTGVTPTADQYCVCPNSTTAIPCKDIETVTPCAGYGVPRAYVRVRVRQNFTTLGRYPGIPDSTVINRRAWMRVR